MSADTVRPCSVMGYPPFPVALVHTQMLGGGADLVMLKRPGPVFIKLLKVPF